MTVKNETSDYEQFVKIQLVELLEMIGRIAEVKFKDSEEEALPLHERCILILELVLPLVGRSVNPVNINEESESESDEDY